MTTKLKYLKKTVETYEVSDLKTKCVFSVDVIQSHKGVHFKLDVNGTFLGESLAECMNLLKELVVHDCYSPIAQEGEAPGKEKFKPVKTTNIDALIAQHRVGLIAKGKGEAA